MDSDGVPQLAKDRRHMTARPKLEWPEESEAKLRAEPTLSYPIGSERPRTRGECQGGERPCPWVSCVYHLYLDTCKETGRVRINFPDLEPGDLDETCALDVADEGGATLDRVGQLSNLTRERIRQFESSILERSRPKLRLRVLLQLREVEEIRAARLNGVE